MVKSLKLWLSQVKRHMVILFTVHITTWLCFPFKFLEEKGFTHLKHSWHMVDLWYLLNNDKLVSSNFIKIYPTTLFFDNINSERLLIHIAILVPRKIFVFQQQSMIIDWDTWRATVHGPQNGSDLACVHGQHPHKVPKSARVRYTALKKISSVS